jgi:hypothetical protein
MTNKSLIEELGELAARWEAVGAQLCPLRTELGRAQGATELRALISKHSASSEAGGPDYRAMYDIERVKFQNETRRTSEYAVLLREIIRIVDSDFGRSRVLLPSLVNRARELTERPINIPATETKAEPVAWRFDWKSRIDGSDMCEVVAYRDAMQELISDLDGASPPILFTITPLYTHPAPLPDGSTASGTNYVADREIDPTRVVFANGRTVAIEGDHLIIGWAK